MQCAGLIPLGLGDMPHHFAATVFTRGCRLRCGYCYHADLVLGSPSPSDWSWSDIMATLESWRNLLDWICISGGEPTLQPDLIAALTDLRGLGYRIQLETSGTCPAVIAKILDNQATAKRRVGK